MIARPTTNSRLPKPDETFICESDEHKLKIHVIRRYATGYNVTNRFKDETYQIHKNRNGKPYREHNQEKWK